MATAIKYTENLALIRAINRELKMAIKKTGSKPSKIHFTNHVTYPQDSTEDASVQHMLNLMRENQVTEKRYCRPADNYKYLAQTYLTYLRSSRIEDELVNKYFNKAERSIKDSARLVGLELPKQNSS